MKQRENDKSDQVGIQAGVSSIVIPATVIGTMYATSAILGPTAVTTTVTSSVGTAATWAVSTFGLIGAIASGIGLAIILGGLIGLTAKAIYKRRHNGSMSKLIFTQNKLFNKSLSLEIMKKLRKEKFVSSTYKIVTIPTEDVLKNIFERSKNKNLQKLSDREIKEIIKTLEKHQAIVNERIKQELLEQEKNKKIKKKK